MESLQSALLDDAVEALSAEIGARFQAATRGLRRGSGTVSAGPSRFTSGVGLDSMAGNMGMSMGNSPSRRGGGGFEDFNLLGLIPGMDDDYDDEYAVGGRDSSSGQPGQLAR